MKLLASFLLLLLTVVVNAAPIQITDSHGKQTFASPPKAVVVINWTLTEQLLELGVMPLAVADIAGYQQQVVKPAIPAAVMDIGLRQAPNLKKITALQPDLILIGYSQRPLARVLSNIAPVVYFNNFSRRYDNEAKARQRFLELAKLFNKTEAAKQKLQTRDKRITELQQQLLQYYTGELPKVSLVLIDDQHDAWVFANNSMPYYALQRLGLKPLIERRPSKLGVHKMRRKDLLSADGCLLVISYQDFDATKSAAWQASKAWQNGCFLTLPRLPLYGGAMSIQYLAESVAVALLHH